MSDFGYDGSMGWGGEYMEGSSEELLGLDLDDLMGLPVIPPMKRACRAKSHYVGLGSGERQAKRPWVPNRQRSPADNYLQATDSTQELDWRLVQPEADSLAPEEEFQPVSLEGVPGESNSFWLQQLGLTSDKSAGSPGILLSEPSLSWGNTPLGHSDDFGLGADENWANSLPLVSGGVLQDNAGPCDCEECRGLQDREGRSLYQQSDPRRQTASQNVQKQISEQILSAGWQSGDATSSGFGSTSSGSRHSPGNARSDDTSSPVHQPSNQSSEPVAGTASFRPLAQRGDSLARRLAEALGEPFDASLASSPPTTSGNTVVPKSSSTSSDGAKIYQEQVYHDLLPDTTPSDAPKAPRKFSLTYESLKELLTSLAEAIATDDQARAAAVKPILKREADSWGTTYQRLAYYFLDALTAREEGTGALKWNEVKNISLEDYKEAMSETTKHLPYRDFLTHVTNGAFIEASKGAEVVHVLDLGWWHGSQWPAFMQALASRPGTPPLLRVTRLDVPGGHLPCNTFLSLEDCNRCLSKTAAHLGLPFQFQGVSSLISDLTPQMLKLGGSEEVLLVNGAKRFHTLSDATVVRSNPRDAAMRALCALKPKLVILGEMQADHNGPFFLRRFEECYGFYAALFESMDSQLPRTSERRHQYEDCVLSRDLTNVVACEGTERIVRSEMHDKWVSRMQAAGFVMVPFHDSVKDKLTSLMQRFPCQFSLQDSHDGALSLAWKQRRILAASIWRPAC